MLKMSDTSTLCKFDEGYHHLCDLCDLDEAICLHF